MLQSRFRNGNWSWAIVLLATLCLVALGRPVTGAAASAAVSISPTHGIAGTEAKLNGSGFAPTAIIIVDWGGSPYTYGQTNPSGVFIEYFAVPGDPAGAYNVTVTDNKGDAASTGFVIDASAASSTSSSTSTSTTATTTSTTTSSTTSPSTTSSSTSSSTTDNGGSKPSTRTVTSTEFSNETTTVVSTETVTQQGPTTTSTASVVVPTTVPGTTLTTTTTQTEPASTVTVTATDQRGGAGGATAPQLLGGASDPVLYVLAGIGILVCAIVAGVAAFRRRASDDFQDLKR